MSVAWNTMLEIGRAMPMTMARWGGPATWASRAPTPPNARYQPRPKAVGCIP